MNYSYQPSLYFINRVIYGGDIHSNASICSWCSFAVAPVDAELLVYRAKYLQEKQIIS